jgi:anti-anti-sigma regulatory factor
MRWRRGSHRATAVRTAPDPIVLPVDHMLTRGVATDLTSQVDRLPTDARVVIDLTGIAGFDTDGATVLLDLQDRVGPDRLTIVGFRQAAARLVGAEAVQTVEPVETASPPTEQGWVIRRLRNLAVVQPADGDVLSTDDLEPMLIRALAEEVAIVVVDLRNTTELTAAGLDAVTFASSAAAVRGQEMLVVNVDAPAADALRRAGLSATTYVAPGPLDEICS